MARKRRKSRTRTARRRYRNLARSKSSPVVKSAPVRRRRRKRRSAVAAVQAPPRRRRRRTRRAAPRVTRRTRRTTARRSRRSSRKRSNFSMRRGLKGFLNKDMISIAGGAVGAGLLTQFMLDKFGPWHNGQLRQDGFKLPGLVKTDGTPNPIGVLLYSVGIPLAAAYAVQRFAPKHQKIAQGLAIGGIVVAIDQAVAAARAKLQPAQVAGGSAYFNAHELGFNQNLLPAPSAINPVSGAYDNSQVFSADPWAS